MESAAFNTMIAAVGLIVFDLTPFITAKEQATLHGMTFSKLIMQSLEYAFYPAMVSLFITGGVFGIIRPQKWLMIGLSLIIFLPLNAIIDLVISPTSHNLLPFELLMYIAFFWAPAVAGAFLGSRIRTGETVWDQPKRN
jgi:hypothetical protein